jgi:Phage major capsid protein E
MLLNTDYYLPVDLTGYVRAALADLPINQFQLARWLPNRTIPDLSYRFLRGTGGLTDTAVYRSFDAESPIGSRPGVTRVSGELPPISEKIPLTEYNRLRQLANPEPAIQAQILTDAERLARKIAARIEVARGDAIVNGSITLNENGVQATVDFGRSGTHSVAAAIPWSTVGSADPLTEMLAWRQTYIDTNGSEPGAALTSTSVVTYLLRNSNLRSDLASLAGTPTNATRTQLSSLLDAHGLPPILTYDAKVKVNGVVTRIIPADKFIYLPAPGDTGNPDGTDLGATQWGTTAQSLDPRFGLNGADAPGLVSGNYTDEDPPTIWTLAAAIALPVLANPDLTFVADVA